MRASAGINYGPPRRLFVCRAILRPARPADRRQLQHARRCTCGLRALSVRPPAVLEMKAGLVLVCLVIAWYASPSTAGAQTPPPPVQVEKHAPAVGAKAYLCVGPSDALARPFQDEPCRWPMYHLPAAAVPSSNEPLPLPRYPQPPAGVQAGHAIFWRFPVQPMGPNEAPRHSFR